MMRMVGAVMVAAGCIWLGDQKARRLTTRVRVLGSLQTALEQMERELRLRRMPLPALMELLGHQAEPPVRGLLQGCQAALNRLTEEPFGCAWERNVGQLTELTESDRRILASLGQILGRYDGAGQAEAVAGTRRALEEQQEQARTDSLRLGRVYRAVGAAGGGFLVILLL